MKLHWPLLTVYPIGKGVTDYVITCQERLGCFYKLEV